jgi:transposase
MSTRDLERAAVFARVVAGTLSLRSAAEILAMSYRQAKRLCGRYRAEGARGVRHRSVGRVSNRARAMTDRTRALALIREKYSGTTAERFGPTLAAEHLASEDGVVVDHETLRRWMLADGLWSRSRKRSPHRRRRERMAHFGQLVQLDGSFHPWFERRGPQSCLLTLVDDATGRSLGRFGAQETIWAAVRVLRAWIETYGIPRALYTDWKNVYVRKPNAEERLTGAAPFTQFGRMCATLGIAIIPASSPQAKGRIERNHGTHQDRLVKKLRRHGIADLDAANAFLETAYWDEHNRRFAQSAGSSDDFHRGLPRRVSLDEVFRLVETRTVSNDWVVRYANRHLQIERQSHQPPARSIVQVLEDARGQVDIRYRGRRMRWTEIVTPSVSAATPRPGPSAARTPADQPTRRKGQGPDHPWHHVVGAHRTYLALQKDRRAWERTQPDREPGTFVTSEDRGHF